MTEGQYTVVAYQEQSMNLLCKRPKCMEKDKAVAEWPGTSVSYDTVQKAVREHNTMHWHESFAVLGKVVREMHKMMGITTTEKDEDMGTTDDEKRRNDPEGVQQPSKTKEEKELDEFSKKVHSRNTEGVTDKDSDYKEEKGL